jgi:hypothetical protein
MRWKSIMALITNINQLYKVGNEIFSRLVNHKYPNLDISKTYFQIEELNYSLEIGMLIGTRIRDGFYRNYKKKKKSDFLKYTESNYQIYLRITIEKLLEEHIEVLKTELSFEDSIQLGLIEYE